MTAKLYIIDPYKALVWVNFTLGGMKLQVTSYVQDKHLTLVLSGEIDNHAARQVMAQITAKIDAYLPVECVLDFGEVRFMDSSGIAVVIHTLRAMRELEGRLILSNIPPQPLKVLRAAGIGKLTELEERSVV